MKKPKKDEIKLRLEEIEEGIQYNEALLEEIFETQESLFPIFADLIRLISSIYTKMGIKDNEIEKSITRLRDAFVEEENTSFHGHLAERGQKDIYIAYT